MRPPRRPKHVSGRMTLADYIPSGSRTRPFSLRLIAMTDDDGQWLGRLPPGQQWAAAGKWPLVGQRPPSHLPDGPWQVEVAGLAERPQRWSLEALAGLGRAEQVIDIHCVTRWSKPGVRFTGVALAALLAHCRAAPEAAFVRFIAYGPDGHDTSLPLVDALRLNTLLAWRCDGAPLALEHGGPVRVVVPNRYFYKSLKWLVRIELAASDRLGYWEREAGYHNTADPWRQQRYMAPALDRRMVRDALARRSFAGLELRSIDARGRDLTGLDARGAVLRDGDFGGAVLRQACFDGANLSNARFTRADLREATFRMADVEGADFSAADLRGADFRGATLTAATFLSAPAPGAAQAGKALSGAQIDAKTRFSAESLDQLMPQQQQFVLAALGK